MPVKTHDFNRVKVSVNGVPISGFIDGDAVSIEFDEDEWSKNVGADGQVARVRQNQPGGTITIRLQPTSDSNAILDGFNKADLLTDFAPVSILVVDTLGGSSFFADAAWVQRDPGATYGREPGDKEWIYDCAKIIARHAGNLSSGL